MINWKKWLTEVVMMDRPLNFVMISPHFPTNFETFAHRLYENGIRTLGIADAAYENLSEGLRQHLTEYYRVEDMHDYDQMYRAVAYFAHKYGKIDRIESHNEYWLELDAKLRTDFNVFGYKLEDMEAVKTKSKMKEIFRQAGVKVARGRVFRDEADARQLVADLAYPVIVKPNSGVGASDTYKIKSPDQLEDFLKNWDSKLDYIMEEFIDGDIITFDGLTDRDGQVVFYSSNEHSETILETVSKDNDMFYYVSREIDPVLLELGTICVKAFNLRERFFHFEFFRVRETGEWMALELNARAPGGLTVDMWNYANDFDIFKEYANVVKFNRFEADIKRSYYCAYISRKSGNYYRHSLEEVRDKFGAQIIGVEQVPGVFAKIMGDLGIIARVETMAGLLEMTHFIHQKQ